jgi:hypothetical protein
MLTLGSLFELADGDAGHTSMMALIAVIATREFFTM